MSIIKRFFGKADNKCESAPTETFKTSAQHPFCIARPIIGFVCMDPSLKNLMQGDWFSLAEFFSESRCSHVSIPLCNVLFIYCRLEDDGRVSGTTFRIRDIAKLSQANIVVVASDNSAEEYARAMQPKNDWRANIVLTNNRNGQRFVEFFFKLFTNMYNDISMPMAWVKLAPQSPHHDGTDAPGTLALFEAGHLTFSLKEELQPEG